MIPKQIAAGRPQASTTMFIFLHLASDGHRLCCSFGVHLSASGWRTIERKLAIRVLPSVAKKSCTRALSELRQLPKNAV